MTTRHVSKRVPKFLFREFFIFPYNPFECHCFAAFTLLSLLPEFKASTANPNKEPLPSVQLVSSRIVKPLLSVCGDCNPAALRVSRPIFPRPQFTHSLPVCNVSHNAEPPPPPLLPPHRGRACDSLTYLREIRDECDVSRLVTL